MEFLPFRGCGCALCAGCLEASSACEKIHFPLVVFPAHVDSQWEVRLITEGQGRSVSVENGSLGRVESEVLFPVQLTFHKP